jgi:alpha-tubulin suppressor-like RCC1 family protein
MASNPVGFEITNSTAGWNGADFDEVFIRKDCFLEGGGWIWGFNVSGQLADNTSTNRSSPVQTIAGGNNWKEINASINNTIAVKRDGTLWTWGNSGSVLGNAAFTTPQSSPIQTSVGGTDWKTSAMNNGTAAGIKSDGTLWTWGLNTNGLIGNNTTVALTAPTLLVSSSNNWLKVSFGQFHVSAIKTDGSLWMWGSNSYGRLGDNTIINRSSPVQTFSGGTNWKQVSAGRCMTAAIKTDGTLWMWGGAGQGQLGTNDAILRSSPIQTVSAGTNWKQVDTGADHVMAIKTDGTLWTWGCNALWGQLGDNTRIDRSSPVQTFSGGTNWTQVSGGFNHSTAIKTDGSLWVWGRNTYGQLGTNNTVNRSSPVQTITAGTSWLNVCAHMSSSNSAAIRDGIW